MRADDDSALCGVAGLIGVGRVGVQSGWKVLMDKPSIDENGRFVGVVLGDPFSNDDMEDDRFTGAVGSLGVPCGEAGGGGSCGDAAGTGLLMNEETGVTCE